MKTAEEWREEICIAGHTPNCVCQRCKHGQEMFPTDGDIKEIQLDAFKAGMTKAAEMVKAQPIHSDFSISHPHGEQLMYEKILIARDNTTTL